MTGKPFESLRQQTVIQTQLFDFTLTPPAETAAVARMRPLAVVEVEVAAE